MRNDVEDCEPWKCEGRMGKMETMKAGKTSPVIGKCFYRVMPQDSRSIRNFGNLPGVPRP